VYAFYTINTTTDKHKYMPFDHLASENRWVRAVSIWATVIDPVVVNDVLHRTAVHVSSRLFLAAQGLFHFY
jgi:hypothetical protein